MSVDECDKIPKTKFQQEFWNAVKTQTSFDTSVQLGPDHKISLTGRNFPDSFELSITGDSRFRMAEPLPIAAIRLTGIEYTDSTFVWLQGSPKSVRETAKFFAELIEICEMIEKCKILTTRPKFDFESLSNVARNPKTAFQKALLSEHRNQIEKGDARAEGSLAPDLVSRWLVGLADGKVAIVKLVYTNYRFRATEISAGLQSNENTGSRILVSLYPSGKVNYHDRSIDEFVVDAGGARNVACLVAEIMEIVPLMAEIGANKPKQ